MNVGTLLVQLGELDPDMQVVIAQSAETELSFGFEVSTQWREGIVALVPTGPTAPLT